MPDYMATEDQVRAGYAKLFDGDHMKRFERWLKAERARIWNEGYMMACYDMLRTDGPGNPYEES